MKNVSDLMKVLRDTMIALDAEHERLFEQEIVDNEALLDEAQVLVERMTKGCRFCDNEVFRVVGVSKGAPVPSASIACTNCGALNAIIYPGVVKDRPVLKGARNGQ